ncbi:hypothetical protein V8E55_002652 [Tylopilus felleus]
MARPVTRTKNLHQHPGQVILRMKQKRRTKEQKQEDDVRAEQARQEEATARERGITCLANIISQSEKEEQDPLKNPPKPRPLPRIVVRPPAEPSSTAKHWEQAQVDFGDTMGIEEEPQEEDDLDDAEADENGDVDSDEDGDVEGDEDNSMEEEAVPVSKKQHIQKTITCDAVQVAQGGINDRGIADDADSRVQRVDHGRQPEKDNQASIQATKNDVVGIGETKDWAGKLASAKLPSLVSSRSSAANSRHAWSVSSTSKGQRAPPPSLCSSARYSSPTTNNLTTSEPVSDAPDGYPYIEGNNQVERKALPIASKVIPHRTNMMDITEIVITSEPDEATPPPTTKPCVKNLAKASSSSRKRAQSMQMTGPQSKRAKTVQPDAEDTSKHSSSVTKKKFSKDDLPPGCTDDNMWRRVFLSAVAHFASTYNNPWAILTEKLLSVLQEMWDTVYGDRIEHTVTVNGPVYRLSQHMAQWICCCSCLRSHNLLCKRR